MKAQPSIDATSVEQATKSVLPDPGPDSLDHMSKLLVLMAPFMEDLDRISEYWSQGTMHSDECHPYHELAEVITQSVSALVDDCKEQGVFSDEKNGVAEGIVWNYFVAQLQLRIKAMYLQAKDAGDRYFPGGHGSVLTEELRNLAQIAEILDAMDDAGWSANAPQQASFLKSLQACQPASS